MRLERLARHEVALLLLSASLLWTGSARAQEHSTADIGAALRQPIDEVEEKRARDADDRFMQTGEFAGFQGRLVTDPEITGRVQRTVQRLLEPLGQDETRWIVRVIEPTPRAINAFVTGGRYVYVFTPLLEIAESDDTLAFVLGHELGHSLLHHNTRRQQAPTTSAAQWAELIAVLAQGTKGLEKVSRYTKAVTASYNRASESEADAFGVVISYKAGFDPIRGVDFFEKLKEESRSQVDAQLRQLQAQNTEVVTAMTSCQQWADACKINRAPNICGNAQQLCTSAESQRVTYNQNVESTNRALESRASSIYDTHPSDQNRIAAVTATVDAVRGARDVGTLDQYPQANSVLLAITIVQPELLEATEPDADVSTAPAATTPTVAERLLQLDELKQQNLITEREYQEKRAEILKSL